MKNKYFKKAIGTFTLFSIMLGVFLISSTNVRAQYMEIINTIVMDGYIDSIDGSGFVLVNSGVDFLSLKVDNNTFFTTNKDFSDLSVGDWVKVIAKTKNGEATAKTVRILDECGYGKQGKPVVIHDVKLVEKTSNKLVVRTNSNALVTFAITTATKYVGTTFADLELGDEIKIIGTDSGANFMAKLVIDFSN
jgi:hypothetical protein